MSHAQLTENEEKTRKIKAILSLKFGLVEIGSILYFRMLADREEVAA